MRTTIFLITLLFTAAVIKAATITVCPDCECSSIGQAIESANAGDEVLIKSGLYQEGNILVDKALRLRGEGWPVIDGENETEVITVTASGVTIEGLVVRNVGTSYLEDRAGIRMQRARNFIIRNNRLENTFFGVYLEHCSDGLVSGNLIEGQAEEEMSSGNAIHLWYCKRMQVEENEVRGHRDGIYFEFVDDSRIRNNTSEDNLRYGLHFMFSNDDDYSRNTFRRNGAGVAVMFSRNINMWENRFEYNWGRAAYGLLLKEIYDAEIRNNTFLENTIGVYVEGSTRIRYRHNEFNRNGWALKMSGGCLDNIVNENNFLHNTFDLSLNSAPNNNSFDGNFWSDYNGYDLGRDGVGDVPYHPVKLFNYVVNRTPEAMVLLRSLFVSLLNFSEKVSPSLTPANVADNAPFMQKLNFSKDKPAY
ncbi:MAG: nitrous oxide reductase family maturation protein NosD [Lewinellaceae bacterium]|nr:nitrous oxide reductase family maturation protein NosD [Lewinellaceae bacterium]MCB9289153.1 nitrous oxide reductase family maturation protein NosD [Lewinellaceae bacterium]